MIPRIEPPPAEPASGGAAFVEMATPALLVGPAGRVALANAQACAMLGCAPEPGLGLGEILARAGIGGAIHLPGAPGASTACRIALSDGRAVSVEARLLPDGGSVLTLNDVSAFVRESELARLDPLTGLANRMTLHARLGLAMCSREPVAVFCLDLDRFKSVNDTLGHPVGDALLRKVAERLLGVVRAGDVVARLGGDEFAVLMPGVTQPEKAEALAARMVDLVGRTYALEGHVLNVTCSIGVALAPADGGDADVLLKNADLALYRAKSEGRDRFRFFEPVMDARMQERRSMEIGLRRALAFREFSLVYQPQLNLGSGEVVGFEALLRWQNPGGGLVSPAQFIPVAEESGLIVPIGEWVLRTACAEAAGWRKPVSIAVNLSPIQLRSLKLVGTVTAALAHTGLDPARLELEITESALLEDSDMVVGMLDSLRAIGVRVSMDDFGTGYSSLSNLQKFPFDKIKIDQSFVRDMLDNPQSRAIVRAVASIGTSLGMKTTAEGVETAAQLEAVRADGCSEVQGYLTGRPLAAADAVALLAHPRRALPVTGDKT
ncbi:MAG TPA: EAL domain-containing protein [Allosphingosinicella sp.]|nr:EAL domain-containing protein [Allosphingosinicella sp.]